MAIKFPSLDFFQELANRMNANPAEFEKLGFCDTVMGVKVDGDTSHLYSLTFDIFDCSDVRELSSPEGAEFDFMLEAPLSLWRESLESIQKHGQPEPAYTLNSLSHVGDRMKVVYDDPEGHDKFYRFMATIQAFVNQASDLEIEWA
ncbi:MAG: hypothetical protein GY723_19110 [bacterium]|nr:hypothetical protein [bacterium]MCP5068262.1 hypothetical protein [bacterium]